MIKLFFILLVTVIYNLIHKFAYFNEVLIIAAFDMTENSLVLNFDLRETTMILAIFSCLPYSTLVPSADPGIPFTVAWLQLQILPSVLRYMCICFMFHR